MSKDTKDQFDSLFNESGANSKGEFIALLLENYANPEAGKTTEKIIEVEKPIEVVKTVEVEKLVEVEKELEANQILLTLTNPQYCALKETILSFSDFAEEQNRRIDKLAPEHDGIFAESHLYSSEIYQLWRRFEPISDNIMDEEREKITKSNISSCLFNAFLYQIFMPDQRWYINKSLVTPRILRELIKEFSTDIEEKLEPIELT
jgi:hypothetical protein